jgi:hypothetical protein
MEQFWLAALNGVIFFLPVAVLVAVCPRRWSGRAH